MNRRLAKEFRPLLLPWGLAAMAGAVAPVKMLVEETAHLGEFWTMVLGIVPFAFFGSIVALGASSFGAEFQHRTLPLLLAQPLRRMRLWNEKLLVLGAAALSVVLIYFVIGLATSLVAIRWFGTARALLTTEQTLLIGIFMLATVCSAGFWTLQARSLLGGMTFCVGAQFLVAPGVDLALEKIYGNKVGGLEDLILMRGIVVTGLVYSAVFLWLGWRKFAGLQLKAVGYGEGGPLTRAFFPWQRMRESQLTELFASRCFGWLRCGPTWATLNLIRKELRLQKPLFAMAAVFSLCWLMTLGLLLSTTTDWQGLYEGILNVLTVIWVPLLAVLAGCVSLGEEKDLGVAEWQLTLPVSTRRQWSVKLVVSSVVGIVLGIGLPLGLAILTSVKSKVGLLFLVAEHGSEASWLLCAWGLIFVVGFWGVTLLGTTVRATLNTAVVLVGLGTAAGLGVELARQFQGLETSLLSPLMIHFQLPPNYFETEFLTGVTLIALFASPVILTALLQSLRQFRRAQIRRWVVWKYSVILLGVAFVMSVWATDLGWSWAEVGSSLDHGLMNAVKALPEEPMDGSQPSNRKVTLKELEETGKLSPFVRSWLKGATIEMRSEPSKGPTSTSKTPVRWITVQFPQGRQFGALPITGTSVESTNSIP